MLLPRRQQLGTLTEVLYDNCFQVILDPELAKHSPTTPNYQAKIGVPTLKPVVKTRLVNRIQVYRKFLAIQKISDLVNEFLSIYLGTFRLCPDTTEEVNDRASVY